MPLTDEDVRQNIQRYEDDISPGTRYASFDYCYNYFASFGHSNRVKDLASPANMRRSCLEIGFYLASWGMYRGGSNLLQRSFVVYEPLIKALAKSHPDYWRVDVPGYFESSNKVLECKEMVAGALTAIRPSETLVTKIMLGIFGNVPAFDRYFIIGSGKRKCDAPSLEYLHGFYQRHKEAIDPSRRLTCTHGDQCSYQYTIAKVLDMVFFIEGMKSGIRETGNEYSEETDAIRTTPPLETIEGRTIAEQIMNAVMQHLQGDLNRTFSRKDIRDTGGFDHYSWQQSCNVIFQGMRVDQHNPDLTNRRFPGVFRRVRHGVYELTDQGKQWILNH